MKSVLIVLSIYSIAFLSSCAKESKNNDSTPDLTASVEGYEKYITCSVKTFENSNESFIATVQKKSGSEEYIFSASLYVVDKTDDGYSTSQKQVQLSKAVLEKNEETSTIVIQNADVKVNDKHPVIAIYDEDSKILILSKNGESYKTLDCANGKYIVSE